MSGADPGSEDTAPRWSVARACGEAGHLHGPELPRPLTRTVRILSADRPALVLGSTQPASIVDHAAASRAGVDVVRRHSGGAAVLLRPSEALWVDIWIPRLDPLWDDDVGRAAHWLGQAWVAALATTGLAARVHRGPMWRGAWAAVACFGGLGPGEVTVSGRKVVGIAQRRTRDGARFQCVVLARWEPDALLSLLVMAPGARRTAAAELAATAAAVPVSLARLERALLARLP